MFLLSEFLFSMLSRLNSILDKRSLIVETKMELKKYDESSLLPVAHNRYYLIVISPAVNELLRVMHLR